MPLNSAKVGLVYHEDYLIHSKRGHPECKERLEHIVALIRQKVPESSLTFFEPFLATKEDIALVHDQSYIASIEQACQSGQDFMDMDTYLVPQSYEVALLSAGGALRGLKEVFEGDLKKVFALIRPPGHHAERARAMGFCLFNNVAIAAMVARRDYGLKKIAIIDWDVHHGNGTEHSFAAEQEVLFISTHQSPAYPGTGGLDSVGRGKGEGFTVNMPLPAGCGDLEYRLFFDQVVIPVLRQYKPELVLISAGQDAYRKDPLAGMALTHAGYYMMAEKLAEIADQYAAGKTLLCLEGGYHLDGQAGAVLQVINAMGKLDLPLGEAERALEPKPAALRRLEEVVAVQRRYWDL